MCCAEVLSQFGVRLTEAGAARHATRFRELHVVDGRRIQWHLGMACGSLSE
ncbi:MAG: hypothetical protein J2P34_08130 [Actinobacteria bacterium]|nr:hypothetical protein [Actinomycetota bacterium]